MKPSVGEGGSSSKAPQTELQTRGPRFDYIHRTGSVAATSSRSLT